MIGLMAACGSTTQAAANSSAQKTNADAAQAFSLSNTAINATPKTNYPDPMDQSALPAAVRVNTDSNGDGDTDESVLVSASVDEGYQVYECQTSSTSSTGYAWTLQAPYTILRTSNGNVILHSTGPSWFYTPDGSMVVGATGTYTDANGNTSPASATPNASAIPWLRVDVKTHLGKTGLFNNVNEIQRLYTTGGLAPKTTCNQSVANKHQLFSSPYTAEYVFWGHN
jgi:hypothetical protein